MSAVIETPLELVEALAGLRLPPKMDAHLQGLMDRNTEGRLSESERVELEALVELSQTMAILRARALRVLGKAAPPPLTDSQPLVLEAGPLHREQNEDLQWAEEQYALGRLDRFAGRHVAVVNRTVYGPEGPETDLGRLIEQAARKAGVLPARVALFYVDAGNVF